MLRGCSLLCSKYLIVDSNGRLDSKFRPRCYKDERNIRLYVRLFRLRRIWSA